MSGPPAASRPGSAPPWARPASPTWPPPPGCCENSPTRWTIHSRYNARPLQRAMNRRIFHAVVLFALASCRKDPLGLTGVQLDIITSDPHLYATSFQMLWLDDSARLFEQRVPDGMGILEAPTASVFIAFDADKAGWRRVVV